MCEYMPQYRTLTLTPFVAEMVRTGSYTQDQSDQTGLTEAEL